MVKVNRSSHRFVGLVLVVLACVIATAAAQAQDMAKARIDASGIVFENVSAAHGHQLIVALPDGSVRRFDSASGSLPMLDLAAVDVGDGLYRWALQPIAAARVRGRDDDGTVAAMPSLSGVFTVIGGAIVSPSESEPPRAKAITDTPRRDQVIPDDLIVQGSACIGFDCVNNENFGFDTIRLKENNLRIKFEDTSAAGFPTVDWQLTANDSTSGGANKFSIDDITSGRTPFTVLANAPSNALFIDAAGRVGFGTSTPVVNLHVNTGNTPTLRLEQNGTSGFTPQTWDVAGNETNFFVRDVTGGSRLSLRILPGAPTNALFIATTGNVGLGTSSPGASLHVRRTDGTAKTFVEEASATVAGRTLLQLTNNGAVAMSMTNQTSTWDFTSTANQFRIDRQGNADIEMIVDQNGNVTIPAGSTYNGSDRTKKSDIDSVDAAAVLAKVIDLPLANWSWKHEPEAYRHLGPMAQDFYATFGLGRDDLSIVPMDMAGVALAAIQGLNAELEARDARIAALEARLAALEHAESGD